MISGRGTPDAEDVETAVARAKVYKSAYRLVSTYWILLVLGAFLLVTLAGPPSLLKTVYLIFFFLFMITYQVSPIVKYVYRVVFDKFCGTNLKYKQYSTHKTENIKFNIWFKHIILCVEFCILNWCKISQNCIKSLPGKYFCV